MDDQNTLRTYIDRVQQLRRAPHLDPEQLRSVAREVGVSDADLLAAEQTSEAHILRGRTLLGAGRAGEARDELLAALALAPWRRDLDATLAETCLALGKSSRNPSMFDEAESYARRALHQEPGEPALADLLNRIDAARQRRRVRWPVLLAVGVMLSGLGVVGLVLAGGVFMGVRSSSTAVEPVSITVPGVPAAPESTVSTVSRTVATEVPLTVEGPDPALVEALRVVSSGYTATSDGKTYYKMAGYLKNTGSDDLRQLTGMVEIFDAAGVVLGTDKVYIVGSLDADLPPSLVAPVHAHEPVPGVPASARLRLDPAEHSPTHPSRPAELTWTVPQPEGASLTAEVRVSSRRSGRNELWVTHTGTRPLGRLQVRLHFFDSGGLEVGTQELRVISMLDPDLEGGTSWSVPASGPDVWSTVTVEVIEVK